MRAVIFAAVLVVVSATPHQLKWVNCTGEAAVLNVSGDPCSSDICKVKSGENVTIYVTFKPGIAVKNLTAKVEAKIGTVLDVPFKIPNPDGCKDSGLECPLVAGHVYTYHSELTIPKALPSVHITVEVIWKLEDENGNPIVCFETEDSVN